MVDTRQQRPAGYDKPTQFWSFCKFSFTPTRVVFLYVLLVINTSRSFPHSRLNTGFVTRLTRRLPLVEQELPLPPEHLSSTTIVCGVRVTRTLVLCVCFVDRCLSFFFWPLCCPFFFDIRILITPLVSSNSSCMGTCVIYETFTKIEYDEIFVIREVIPISFMLSITFYLILFT